MKKMTAALLCFCLLFIACASSYAEETPATEASVDGAAVQPVAENITSSGYALGYLGDGSAAQPVRGESLSMLSGLPAAFDLRTAYGASRVGPVRNQNPYGTCWAFAAVSAAESNLLMDGKGSFTLSPLQLAYFTYNRSEAVSVLGGGTAGDKVTYTPMISRYGDTVSVLNRGGVTPDAITAMANHLGLSNEAVVPYSNAEAVVSDGLEAAYAFDADAAHLQNAYVVNLQDRAHIKALLMRYGAASIDYYHHDYFYSPTHKSYYCPGNPSNHAVTLIGWDDAFPAANFDSGYCTTAPHDYPPENGAWLIKNSWGTSWGDNGYFWISYADGSLTNATFMDVSTADDYDTLYQYDGGVYSHTYNLTPAASEAYQGVVYTAAKDSAVCAVSFYADSSDLDVGVSVYTDLADAMPNSGTLVAAASASRSLDYTGYYTLPLSAPVFVQAGSRFSIVLKLKDRDGDAVGYVADTNSYYYGVQNIPVAAENRTFWSVDGKSWSDFGAQHHDELRIKAFAVDASGLSGSSRVAGDVNGDGVLSLADAILLCRHVTELDMLSGRYLAMADVNASSSVNVADVVILCRRLAGLPDTP